MLLAALFILTACSSTSTSPPAVGSAVETYKKGVPGGVLVQTVKVTATVTAIDQAKRKATLQGSDGKKFTVQVGRQAVNFDQVRVGDEVTTTITQKVVGSLDNREAPSDEALTAAVARAAKGDQSSGLAAETIQSTGEIIAIDPHERTATPSVRGRKHSNIHSPPRRGLGPDQIGRKSRFPRDRDDCHLD